MPSKNSQPPPAPADNIIAVASASRMLAIGSSRRTCVVNLGDSIVFKNPMAGLSNGETRFILNRRWPGLCWSLHNVGRHKLFYEDAKTVRNALNDAIELGRRIHGLEGELIRKLQNIDRKRYYVRYGYKSLMGFTQRELGFTKTQAQRITTQVRRNEPMANIGDALATAEDIRN